MHVYSIDILDVGEVDELVVFVESVGAGEGVGVGGEVDSVVVVYLVGELPRLRDVMAMASMVSAKRAPQIVQRMSVFLRSLSGWDGGYLRAAGR